MQGGDFPMNKSLFMKDKDCTARLAYSCSTLHFRMLRNRLAHENGQAVESLPCVQLFAFQIFAASCWSRTANETKGMDYCVRRHIGITAPRPNNASEAGSGMTVTVKLAGAMP